jgi:hypothetical protein
LPNKNYRRGVVIERKIKDYLEILGYTVIRSAGSHGVYDLIAVNENQPSEPVRCIQVKRAATLIGAKRIRLKHHFPTMQSGFQSYKQELWIWVDRKGWLHELEEGLTNSSAK